MLWSQQVEEEEAQLLAKLHSSKPMHESSHMPNKMLTLYYDHSEYIYIYIYKMRNYIRN